MIDHFDSLALNTFGVSPSTSVPPEAKFKGRVL